MDFIELLSYQETSMTDEERIIATLNGAADTIKNLRHRLDIAIEALESIRYVGLGVSSEARIANEALEEIGGFCGRS